MRSITDRTQVRQHIITPHSKNRPQYQSTVEKMKYHVPTHSQHDRYSRKSIRVTSYNHGPIMWFKSKILSSSRTSISVNPSFKWIYFSQICGAFGASTRYLARILADRMPSKFLFVPTAITPCLRCGPITCRLSSVYALSASSTILTLARVPGCESLECPDERQECVKVGYASLWEISGKDSNCNMRGWLFGLSFVSTNNIIT